MDWQGKSIRIGGTVIGCAILLRLFAGALPGATFSQKAMSTVMFLETGRVLGSPTAPPTEPPPETEPTVPVDVVPEPSAPKEAVAVFSEDDAALVKVHNVCGLDTNVAQGLTQTLSWDLTAPAPTVLIIHSHGSESYENTEGYTPSGDYRTLELPYNVVSIGDRLVQVLETAGIRAVHDRQIHDNPSYTAAYANARDSIEWYLEQYPSICLVLDIHRDAVADSSGQQMKFTVDNGEQAVAQLMLVVGTDAGGLTHPHWPDNMSLAVKLHAQLEKLLPGSCRPISFRSQRFNQDLSPGALIVEVGAAGNTRQEALAAVELLGQAITAMAKGTAAE